MAPLLGIVMLALGLSLLVVWWPAVGPFLQGLLVVSLIFWGFVLSLVGYSEQKARRDAARETAPTTDDAEESAA